MKILKIALISIAGLIVLIVMAVVIFIKAFDVNRYKPQIIGEASKALARQVDFQKAYLGISLFRGIELKISNLSISEDPAFGKGEFLAVKDILVGVDVWGYILQKKISITSILIDSPKITLIRQKDSSFNVQTVAKPAEAGKEIVKSSPATAALAIPAILISSIKTINGTLTYIDYSFEPPLRLEALDLTSTVSKVSLTAPFPFVVEAAVLSAKKNIRLEGKASFDLKTNEVTITKLKGATELSDILMNKIPDAFPMTKGAVLPASLKGNLGLTMDKLIAGPKGLGALAADCALANGNLQFKELASPVKDMAATVKITENKISFDKVSAAIGEGLINAKGVIEDYLAKQDYSVSADIKDLKLQDLIALDKSPVKVEGIAAGKINIKGSGFSPEALKSSLSGNADLSVIKAKLKDINVLRTVLDKISVIPGLSQKIEAGLPEKFKQKLIAKDTVLSDIKLPVVIENGRAIVKDVSLGADEFLFKANGEAGLSGDYSLEGSFLISQELSASMVAAVSQLQYLLNEENQIYIPLKVSGNAGEMKFRVDPQYIAQKLVANQAKQQLFKALDKALGTKEPAATEQNAASSDSNKKSATEEAVGNLLNSIFKKK